MLMRRVYAKALPRRKKVIMVSLVWCHSNQAK
jgi:hypothetical protein